MPPATLPLLQKKSLITTTTPAGGRRGVAEAAGLGEAIPWVWYIGGVAKGWAKGNGVGQMSTSWV